MPSYSVIAGSELAVNKPLTSSLMTRLNDNPIAIFEQLGWAVTAGVFISPEQTITAAGVLVLNHGLTISNPLTIDVEIYLVCKIDELGYVTNDITIPIMDVNNAGGNMSWPSIKLTTTQLDMRYGTSPFTVTNHTNGQAGIITAANWKMVIKARG